MSGVGSSKGTTKGSLKPKGKGSKAKPPKSAKGGVQKGSKAEALFSTADTGGAADGTTEQDLEKCNVILL